MDLYATNGTLLYSSRQPTLKRALGEAIDSSIALAGLNLRRVKLRGAKLDGLRAPGACLWGADFTGADLAGADISGVDARMATFSESCLAEALCTNARFEGAFFRQTLIQDADFSGCTFSCPSILQQNLHDCCDLTGAIYWHRGEEACPLDEGVTRLTTGGHTIVVLGKRLIANGELDHKNIPSAQNTTKSGINLPKNAKCESL